MMERFNQYWASREPRERLLLMVCAGLLAVAVLYALWAPLASAQDKLSRRLPQLRQDAQHMEQMVQQWQSAAGSRTQQDWRAAAQARLLSHSLSTQQARLLSSDAEVQRWQFDKVAFTAFLDWLTSLYNDFGVRVKSAKLQPSGPGAVNVTLELTRP